ncbi:cache domain-containing sensor histidine kinase [Cohnella silvisoli]|uniref:Sensor histidine kinase n=1 Tax=Cohnella silvisoli TaxID=2873699 RepID=A0ABV1KTX3_9BACL|nr:sensor histidine kinase [Cohnella silvisoli]MCD9021509.1 sensor histidine kinase [Cohnella silvisoli]
MFKITDLFKNTMAFRLFIIYVLVISFPLFIYGLISYKLSAANVEADYIKYKENVTAQMIRNIDENMLALQKQSSALFLISKEINYFLGPSALAYSDQYFEVKERMDKYFLALLQMNSKLNGITLIDSKGDVKYAINVQGKNSVLGTVADENWFKETLKLNGAPYFLDPHTNDFIFNENKINVISVSQSIIDYSINQSVGVLLVDQNVDHFFNDVAKINLQEDEQIAIISKTGNLIYSNIKLDEATKEALLDANKSKAGANSMIRISDKQLLLISSKPSQYGFQVISLLPLSELQKKSLFLKDISIVMLIIIAIIIFIISIVVAYMIVKPLRKLMSSFRKLEKGHFDTRVTVRGKHELAQINAAFNKMAENVGSLIHEKYEANLLRKQSEFDALQSQINPHFLYNTLYSTKAIIDNHDYDTASNMVQNLAEIFRYSLNQGRHLVALSDEIAHIRKYLYLLETRFKGKYKIVYDIDESLRSYELPRLTLQPLVENAIRHGLEEKMSGEIHISAKSTGEHTVIYIFDNGRGMTEQRVQVLNEAMSHNRDAIFKEDGHIGMINVNSRIKLHFGPAFGIKVSSKPDKFTTVKIILPGIHP